MRKIIYFLLIGLFCITCNDTSHDEPDTKVDLKRLKGAVIMGKSQNVASYVEDSQLIAFKRGDSLWVENYKKVLFDSYDVGDTIK